jgi:hypothetical protein
MEGEWEWEGVMENLEKRRIEGVRGGMGMGKRQG